MSHRSNVRAGQAPQPLEDIHRRRDEDHATTAHPLTEVFRDTLHQVTDGKGERHGGARVPFFDQQWASLAQVHGDGFLTGQAVKKVTEAVQSGHRVTNPEAYERELMGAIAYLGMAILHRRMTT